MAGCGGRAGRLRGHLEHQSFDSVPHLFKKQLVYGLSTGRQLHARGRRPSLATIVAHTVAAFFKFYCLRGLFLRGAGGFITALSLAGSTFVAYATAWELALGPSSGPVRDRVPGEGP